MKPKTWPYGTIRRATVQAKFRASLVVIDDQREGHVLVGENCADLTAAKGDSGTVTFTKGGPTGGYWKFVKDKP